MDHRLVRAVEKAVAWSGEWPVAARFAHGPLGDPGLGERLLTPRGLLDALAYRAMSRPQVRCLQAGAELHPREYLENSTTRRAQAIERVHLGRLGRLLGEGCTLVVDAVNQLDPTLDVACRALQWWSGQTVQANAYLTTGSAAGFDLHFDDHDVLVVQVSGAKSWEVRGAARVAPLYRDVDANTEPPSEVVWSGALRAGEVLAIPRGFWHRATRDDRDAGGHSLHVTFGFTPRTGVDWVGHLADLVREQHLFRTDLANGDHTRLTEALSQLAAATAPTDYLQAWQDQQRSARRVVTGGAFGPPTAVVCVTDFPPRIDDTGTAVTVTGAGREVTFAAKARPALERLLSGQPADLAEVTAATGANAARLAEVLVEEGLCAEMTPALFSAYTGLG